MTRLTSKVCYCDVDAKLPDGGYTGSDRLGSLVEAFAQNGNECPI